MPIITAHGPSRSEAEQNPLTEFTLPDSTRSLPRSLIGEQPSVKPAPSSLTILQTELRKPSRARDCQTDEPIDGALVQARKVK